MNSTSKWLLIIDFFFSFLMFCCKVCLMKARDVSILSTSKGRWRLYKCYKCWVLLLLRRWRNCFETVQREDKRLSVWSFIFWWPTVLLYSSSRTRPEGTSVSGASALTLTLHCLKKRRREWNSSESGENSTAAAVWYVFDRDRGYRRGSFAKLVPYKQTSITIYYT